MVFDFNDVKRFLEDVKSNKLIGGRVINNIAGFGEIIDSYGLTLEKFIRNNGIYDTFGSFKNYIREINIEGYYKYILYWNINKIVEDLKISNYPVIDILVSDIIESVDMDNIDLNYVKNVSSKNNSPIIVIRLPQLCPNDIIIDGNHRAVWNYINKKKVIRAYYLPYNVHAPYITSEFFRLLYMVECNISICLAYMSGMEKEYEKYLFEI